MRKPPILLSGLAMALAAFSALAGEEPPERRPPLVRELYVPFADLSVLLENQPRRVLLERAEYEELLAKAKKAPEEKAPRAWAVLSADTRIDVAEDRANFTCTLDLEVLEQGLHAVPLSVAGVGLREATLGGKPASVGAGKDGRLVLFVEGRARHTLSLDMVAPLQTTAAQQALAFRVPHAPAARMALTVPGDVEIKTGAEVASRVVEDDGRQTRFVLVPRDGDMSLVMTLNSRLARQDRVVMARSVTACEVAQAYEGLHAAISMEVLHRAVDRFRFALPEGFDVTDVSSPMLARWNQVEEQGRSFLEVQLREQTTERVVLDVSAVRTPPRLAEWSVPRLEPLEVAGHTGVVVLLSEDRLKTLALAPTGLIRIDTPADLESLVRVLPESMEANVRPAPGTPLLKPVAMYYAPQSDYGLAAQFEKLPARLAVTTNALLILSDRRQEVHGAFVLLPEVEELFGMEFSVPAGWSVEGVTGPDGTALAFEHERAGEEAGRVRAQWPQGVTPGQTYTVRFRATRTPPDWLRDWKSHEVAMPVFAVRGAARDVGAVAVSCTDDIVARLGEQERLIPLAEAEKPRFGLGGVPTQLAYRYESQPYRATFVAERTAARRTAKTFSFLRILPDVLSAHYEVIYRVEEARTDRLSLLLPKGTPKALAIRALDGVGLKEYDATDTEQGVRWDVLLAEPRRGTVRLAVDFQQPLGAGEKGEVQLPLIRAADVAYQSGLVAVEGSAELDVEVRTDARQVDVGELVEAAYQPGRRLLGVHSFAGDPPPVAAAVAPQASVPLYPAIVEKAALITLLSASGVSQTQATFELRTKALFLELTLPAESKLWSAEVNGAPIKPQREEDGDRARILVSLPAAAEAAVCRLRIVYQTPTRSPGMTGRVSLAAPALHLRAEAGAVPQKVPLADLQWKVRLPSGYELVASDGTVSPTELETEPPAAAVVAVVMYVLGGGTPGPGYIVRPMSRAAREVAETAVDSSRSVGRAYKTEKKSTVDESLPSPYYMSDDAAYAEQMDAEGEQRRLAPGVEKGPPDGDEAEPDALTPPERPAGSGEAMPREEPPPPPRPRTPAEPETKPATPPAATRTPELPQSAEKKPGKSETKALDDLAGVRSLQIELGMKPEEGGSVVTFQSLGEAPLLSVTVAHRPRLVTLGWALALLVALVGLVLIYRSARAKARFILLVAAIATLVPVLPGMSLAAGPANMAFFAAALLVPFYLAVWLGRLVLGLVGWVLRGLFGYRRACATAAALALAVLLTASATAAPPEAKGLAALIELIEPAPPVSVPEDAVIIPYDPDSDTGIRDAEKMMVPYAKYVELWNRAYPDKKLQTKAPPAPYGLAGTSYSTRLSGDEYLRVEGQVTVEVFAEGYVSVPLALDGGVLTRAELDGRPAQISLPMPAEAAPRGNEPQKAEAAQPRAAPAGRFVVLQVSGKGRHELKLSVRMPLQRRGGWRIASGTLPAGPAASLAIVVPQERTEVRLSQVADRTSYDTEAPNQRIETALGAGGRLHVEWRPQVTAGEVDRALTAESDARLDVEESGLSLFWPLSLQFPRSQRERFTLSVPPEYLVEKVEGGNVRGWTARRADGEQTVEVTLLKAAKDRESFALRLWRQGPVGEGAFKQFDVPLVRVPEAGMQSGRITIRRSPLLELRAESTAGVTRIDVAASARPDSGPEPREDASTLGIEPFQAFRFASVPFTVRLAAEPAVARVRAEVQTVLKIAEIERTVEARVKLDVEGRPIYRVEVFLPHGLADEAVAAPGRFDWAVTALEDRRLLTVFLSEGQQGEVQVLVDGTMPGKGPGETVPVPRFEVRGVLSQRGDIAVQADPGVKVELRDPENLQTPLVGELASWLADGQRNVTRLALRYHRPDYAGTLALGVEEPEVLCTTISNVRFTSRAVEETILLDYTVRKAGVRELAFLLPPSMADARISVPDLQQKTVEPAPDGPEGWRRAVLRLQDEKIGQLRVLVQNDRLLERDATYEVPIPRIESGRAVRQYVTLQSAGRDEIVPGEPRELEPLSSGQNEWRTLEGYRLGGITRAYAVSPGAADPRLRVSTRVREAVRTAGASIGLAETDLVVDAAGAYRGEVVYRVDNSTEQFLQIALPGESRLWTARVDGEPVKPAEVPQGAIAAGDLRAHVRIPLVKTAPGELDYEVRVQYGGAMKRPRAGRRTRFPLVETVNIRVQRSQVRLHLPERFEWFDFRGTMGLVEDEGDLAAQRFDYYNKLVERLVETSREADAFAKARATSNLKQLGMAMKDMKSKMGDYAPNEALQQQLVRNAGVLQEAEEQVRRFEAAPPTQAEMDNRSRLNDLYAGQGAVRWKNTVQDVGGNWDVTTFDGQQPSAPRGNKFNDAWLDENGLLNQPLPPPADDGERGGEQPPAGPGARPSQPRAGAGGESRGDRHGGGEQGGGQRLRLQDAMPQGQAYTAQQPQAADVVVGKLRTELQKDAGRLDVRGLGTTESEQIMQYQQRLEKRLQQAPVSGRTSLERKVSEGIAELNADVDMSWTARDRKGQPGPDFSSAVPQMGGDFAPSADGVPDRSLAAEDSVRLWATATGGGRAPQLVGGSADGGLALTGMASLDVTLPKRGRVYRFTTPGGDCEIVARSASHEAIRGWIQSAVVVVVVLLALSALRMGRAGGFDWVLGAGFSTALIALGALALLLGFFPVYGLLAVIAGIAIKIYRRLNRPLPAAG